jgi:hypothetical protein
MNAIAMKTIINEIRGLILDEEKRVLTLKQTIVDVDLSRRADVPQDAPAADRGEMIANVMLAYRHLEDARMRLGKAIQAYDGGVSVYDKKP